MDRKTVLLHLLQFDAKMPQVIEWMDTIPWASDQDLVVLNPSHVINVLNRYLSNEFLPADVEMWAANIEMREDIGIEATVDDKLINVLFELANPSITYALTPERAKELLETLNSLLHCRQ